MTNAPIFIVGTPRSGTTLTAKILGRHSRIFMPGETQFFEDIYSRRNELGGPDDPEALDKIMQRLVTLYARYNERPDQKRIDRLLSNASSLRNFKERCHSCQTYEDVFTHFMEWQMVHEGKRRWGNNTPRDIFSMPDILGFYPNAKILVCVRDLRDFLSSYRNKWKITSDQEAERLRKLYHPILTSLLWKSSVRLVPSIRSRVSKGNFMIVRYEDLVREPERLVQEICATIEEEFEGEMLNVEYSNSSSSVTERGIYSVSVGAWKKNLAKEDARAGELMAANELRQLGYTMERPKVNQIKMVALFITFPFALWRAFYINRQRRGPLTSYICRRVWALFSRA